MCLAMCNPNCKKRVKCDARTSRALCRPLARKNSSSVKKLSKEASEGVIHAALRTFYRSQEPEPTLAALRHIQAAGDSGSPPALLPFLRV